MKPLFSEPVDIETPYGPFDTYVGRYGDRNGTFLIGHKRGQSGEAPLVRAQYGCFHGTVFRSLSCDCSWQIEQSLSLLGKSRSDALFVYFIDHEAYGIGIFEKMALLRIEKELCRSYAELVSEGRYRKPDNSVLGVIPTILEFLGLPKRVTLLTSNPDKVVAVQECGIEILNCLPITNQEIPELQRRASG